MNICFTLLLDGGMTAEGISELLLMPNSSFKRLDRGIRISKDTQV